MSELIARLTRRVLDGESITRGEAEQLVASAHDHHDALLDGAKRIREHYLGNRVRGCSIVAAKVGKCPEDCAFCSQSAHYKTAVAGLTVLDEDEVIAAADDAADNGADSFGIVNSGLGPRDDEVEKWGRVISRIREKGRLRACASLGVLEENQAERLADLGLQRYNHNLQTSRRHFPNIIRTHDYDDRLATMRRVKAAGMSLCSGALFGMGEDWCDRLDLAFELRNFMPDVIPLNFLIPIDGTPLAGSEPMDVDECLAIIAIFRFIFPEQEIKIAGGREVNLAGQQYRIFDAGADSFLIGNYLTTCGRNPDEDRQMVTSLGLDLVGYDRQAVAVSQPGADRLEHVS